ncbi:thrombospondin type 3 repeat-containing protein [Shewanella vaxholmensis]|uniref:thrombospondin type 3 repeat-containing protein n=1 Tax=Shewanella vaxholmensis TaxID=3063535 RepID=UPI00289047CE|nr:thrombospondin type 3 repeat-containing protein [Shewanella sp. SP1S1-4]MDT3307414.1 thrombospondin type 3 repeat-containing protein [Shewanella sp. SP1S1-4]
MQEKLTINDKSWFETTHFKGMETLSTTSDMSLKVVSFFYPLSMPKQLLLSLGLLLMCLVPFITPGAIALFPQFPTVPLTLVIINMCLVPGHFIIRHYLIKNQYKLNDAQHVYINSDRISLPVNSLVNEPNGQLELTKKDIGHIDIVYWVQTNKGVTTRTIYEIDINLVSGKLLKLDALHYPLKQMFYLMVYFDYPVNTIKRHFSANYVDGLDDSLEPAFGLSNIVIDTDNDKIFDANEFYAYDYSNIYSHDVDKDGIPNWLDDDSDGDGILDSVEGVFDLERDGFASFVDLDSDGNGENDDSEVGSTNMMPKDSDNDGLYDFLDVVDDNDGLLDIHDNDPLNALKVAMPGEPGYRNIVYTSYIYNREAIHDIHIAEEAHSISGRGLIGTGFLVFDMGKEIPPLNIPVTSNNSENITFLMPRNAKSIYFVADGFRSNRVAVNYSNERIAIINALNEQYFTEGTTIELTGKNFFEDTKVLIDDLIVEPSINSTSSLTFILPSGLSPEVKISLKTTYGNSNSRVIKVGKNIALTIVEPNSINIDTTKLFAVSYQSPTKKRYPVSSMHSTSVIVGSGYDIIVVMHQDEHGVNFPYLYRAVFDIPLETSISPLDSAISVAWYKSGIRRSVPTTEWINTYKAIGELAATRTLAEYIASHMDNLKYTANPDYIALERFAVEATRFFSRELYNAQKENLKAKINNVAS